jgi:DNA-binding Lrp family transcriptional regulator
VDKELQAYYEARFDMMTSKGWQDLVEDLRKVEEVSKDLDRCNSVEDLYYAKGQLDILNFIFKLKEASEDAYEELTR